MKQWTYEEVSKHNKADDCWLVIDDKVYDVTSFVPKHPGGNMIYLNAGRESTRLFQSYHPEKVKELLPKYLVGTVKDTNIFRIQYANDEEDRALNERIKKKVLAYFKERKMDPRFSWGMYIKCAVILISYMLSFYAAFFYFQTFWMAALSAMMVGFCAAEVGVSVQHDANHGAFHKNPEINKWVGTTLDYVGGSSSFIWKQQHVFGHHCYTNIHDVDPDIRVGDPDVRRNTVYQPWHPYHVYQHLYLGWLYGLLAVKSVFVDDIKMYVTGWIGNVPVNHLHLEEAAVFFSGKAWYLFYYLLLPILYSHHGIRQLMCLWLITQFVTGWMLAFMFQVNHVTEDLDFYNKKGDDVTVGWTRTQIEGTAGFSHGSWFWTNVSGGLNYQVEHHLFPWVCHMHYPAIAPIVREICAQEGIHYVAYPSFLSAVKAHFNLMKHVGKGFKSD